MGARPAAVPEVLTGNRIVSLIDEEDVIERILSRLRLWQRGRAFRHRPAGLDPWLDDPFPDFLGHLKRPAARERASRTLAERPPALRRQLFRVAGH